MKTSIFFLFAFLSIHTAEAIYVKTMFKGEPEQDKMCCIELAHMYYTDDHEYIAMGFSYASLLEEACCEKELNTVTIDSSTVSQFKKEYLKDVAEFNRQDGTKASVDKALLKYKLSVEGKKGKIEVTQNPVSGKLVLSFTTSEAGKMNLSVEPQKNNYSYYTEVEVKKGKNEVEIDYVPYNSSTHNSSFMNINIVLLNETEVLSTLYRHKFR